MTPRNYNPRDIIRNCRHLLNNGSLEPMLPWYRGFRGSIAQMPEQEGRFEPAGTSQLAMLVDTGIGYPNCWYFLIYNHIYTYIIYICRIDLNLKQTHTHTHIYIYTYVNSHHILPGCPFKVSHQLFFKYPISADTQDHRSGAASRLDALGNYRAASSKAGLDGLTRQDGQCVEATVDEIAKESRSQTIGKCGFNGIYSWFMIAKLVNITPFYYGFNDTYNYS